MNERQMFKEIKIKKINPIYAIGFTWLIFGLFLPLYRITDLLIATGISLLCYLMARRFIPEKTIVQPITSTGSLDTRCMQIIEMGYAYIEDLEKAKQQISKGNKNGQLDEIIKERISGGNVNNQINQIIKISRQMLDYTAKNPRLALDLRSFIDYYFPVTLKLLNAYSEMHEQSIKSENAAGIIDKVSSVMETIVTAFKKQLDLMYADKRLDIKTDIEVLKTLLASEGLTESGKGVFK